MHCKQQPPATPLCISLGGSKCFTTQDHADTILTWRVGTRKGRGRNGGRGNNLHNIAQITSKSQGRSSAEAGLGAKSTACLCCSLPEHLQAMQPLSPGGKRGEPQA